MRCLAALALFAACRSAPVATPTTPSVKLPTTLDPGGLDAWLASELKSRGVVGASVVVLHDGAIVLAKGYGTREAGTAAPVSPDTPFAIGSVSKQLTCAATMLLADDGKLELDDRVAKYYPELVRAADITLDDLGAHMSGYRDYYPLDYLDSRMITPIGPDELLAKYAGLPLDFEPRSRWSYSNTGFVLLARIVERVSGMPFAKFVEQRIFKQLSMTSSSVGKPPPGAATGHTAFQLGPVTRATPEAEGWLLGAADVYASAQDLVRWDLAFSTGAILSASARRAMTTPHRTNEGRIFTYGCGLGVRIDRGETVLSHTGAIEGFFAFNTFVPRTRSAVVLLVNDTRAEVADLHQAIVGLVLQRPTEIPVVPGPTPEDTTRLLVRQLQRGVLDRSKLGDDLNSYFDDKRIAELSVRLRALGEPTVSLIERHERGAMEVTTLELTFPAQTLMVTMFRSPLGKIHQFLLRPA
jgi:CubicO group peptidase (beta-lactamase class C family)